VIEVEGFGESETVSRLSVNMHLIAEDLTPEETRLLVVGILDRIGTLEVGRNTLEHPYM